MMGQIAMNIATACHHQFRPKNPNFGCRAQQKSIRKVNRFAAVAQDAKTEGCGGAIKQASCSDLVLDG